MSCVNNMHTVHGLHHITAIAGPAQENLDFYAGILGMRLVKRSINQDDPGTYHLFYADAEGHPGTAAPLESVMLPRSVPVTACAEALDGTRHRPAASASAVANRVARDINCSSQDRVTSRRGKRTR